MASVSVANFTGRMFDKPVVSNSDGLLAKINYSGGGGKWGTNKSLPTGAMAFGGSFNASGDKFAISDNRGSLTVFHLSGNRYVCIARDTKTTHKLAFTPSDKVILAQHTSMTVHSLNGKLEAEMKGHKQPISGFKMNAKHNMLMSQSSDVINLWSLSTYDQ